MLLGVVVLLFDWIYWTEDYDHYYCLGKWWGAAGRSC